MTIKIRYNWSYIQFINFSLTLPITVSMILNDRMNTKPMTSRNFLTPIKRRTKRITRVRIRMLTEVRKPSHKRNVTIRQWVLISAAVSLMSFTSITYHRVVSHTSNQTEKSVITFIKEVIAPTKIGYSTLKSIEKGDICKTIICYH